jgi:hypothetical protein
MKLAITILAFIAIAAGVIAESNTPRFTDFAGWGVIFLGIAVVLIENG